MDLGHNQWSKPPTNNRQSTEPFAKFGSALGQPWVSPWERGRPARILVKALPRRQSAGEPTNPVKPIATTLPSLVRAGRPRSQGSQPFPAINPTYWRILQKAQQFINQSLRGPSSFFVALRGYLFSLACRSEARPRWYSCDPSVVRSRQSRLRLCTSSQRSDVQDRCMASWISATAKASLNPGSPCFRLATELRNSMASINLRSS